MAICPKTFSDCLGYSPCMPPTLYSLKMGVLCLGAGFLR